MTAGMTATPGHAMTCSTLRHLTPITLTTPDDPEAEIVYGTALRAGMTDTIPDVLSPRDEARLELSRRARPFVERAAALVTVAVESKPGDLRRLQHPESS